MPKLFPTSYLLACLFSAQLFSQEFLFIPEISQTFGQGLGFDWGYTTLQVMGLRQLSENTFSPFFDLRGHRFVHWKDHKAFESEWAANAGLGVRYLNTHLSAILGANVYYDFRSYKQDNFSQIGLGLEYLTPLYQVRLNGYLPINEISRPFTCVFDRYKGGYVMIRNQYQTAFKALDAELELKIIQFRDFFLFGAAGPYYLYNSLRGCSKKILGGSFRLTAYYKYFFADGIVTTDHYFRTRFLGRVSISVPLDFEWLFTWPIRRREIIPTRQKCFWKTNF